MFSVTGSLALSWIQGH